MVNIVVTGLTAARMLAIEAASVVSGVIQGDNLILTKHDGTTINAGNVRGPQGIQGPVGTITVSPAGGALTGNYPSPLLAANSVTDVQVVAANKDGAANKASMRTLGLGALQAAAGNHNHGSSGWVDATASMTTGDPPFGRDPIEVCDYWRWGPMCYVRIRKAMTGSVDLSGSNTGNFVNMDVARGLPVRARPDLGPVFASARVGDAPAAVALSSAGVITWTGGFPRNYAVGTILDANFFFMTENA